MSRLGADIKRRIANSKFKRVEGFAQNLRGRIMIQDHGSKVWLRNITVRRLGSDSTVPQSRPVATEPETMADSQPAQQGAGSPKPQRTLRHQQSVQSVRFSPDGQSLASCAGPEIATWDLTTGQRRLLLTDKQLRANIIDFNPDGTKILAACVDGAARILDASNGAILQKLQEHQGSLCDARYSPDGTRIVTSSHDKTIRIWDARTGAVLFTLQGHQRRVWRVAISPDGSVIASGGPDRTVRLWDMNTGQAITVLGQHSHAVDGLAFSPDGKQLVSAGGNGTIQFWNLTNKQQTGTLEAGDRCRLIDFNPDGRFLATSGTPRVWNVSAKQLMCVLQQEGPPSRCVAFDPQGQTVAAGFNNGTIRVWPLAELNR